MSNGEQSQYIAQANYGRCLLALLFPIVIFLIHTNHISKTGYSYLDIIEGTNGDIPYIKEYILIGSTIYLLAVGWYGAALALIGGSRCIFTRGDRLIFVHNFSYKSVNFQDLHSVNFRLFFLGKKFEINTKSGKKFTVLTNMMDVKSPDILKDFTFK